MNILLLIGSPKVKQSNSEALSDYLLQQLIKKGAATQKMIIRHTLQEDGGMDKLLSAVNACDVLILSFPLYVDSLPSSVIKVMEAIADQQQGSHISPPHGRDQALMAICNCGFPEAKHNNTALAICRCFAKSTGFQWLGGLLMGSGEVIGGKPLANLGGMVRNQVKALDMAAEAITQGKHLPEEAVDLFKKPLVPRWLFLCCGYFGWRRQARENGVLKRIREQPYK